jgi:predicted MFS family arabinose efflux permease
VLTYRALFADRGFRALWAATALTVAAGTAVSLALASAVYARTGSALLSAVALFGPSLMQLVGATTLMSVADAGPPRRTLAGVTAVVAAVGALQALLPLDPLARLGLVLATAYVVSLGAGARWGLLTQILPEASFRLARSAMNVAGGAFQVVGFAVGGLLLQVLSVRGVFALAAVLCGAAVLVLLTGLSEQAPRRAGRPGLRATWHGNRRLLAEPHTRPLLLALCLPNGLVVGCEALFVPYAEDAAGVLFVAGALGMLCGDVLVGRVLDARQRRRWGTPLRVLLAAAFLPFVLPLPLAVAAALAALGSVGYGASLLQQEQLVVLAPEDVRGQALGVEGSARTAAQGACAVLAGALADAVGAGLAITLLAASSLVVTALLAPALARAQAAAHRAGA